MQPICCRRNFDQTSGRNATAIGRSSKANQSNATALGAGSTATVLIAQLSAHNHLPATATALPLALAPMPPEQTQQPSGKTQLPNQFRVPWDRRTSIQAMQLPLVPTAKAWKQGWRLAQVHSPMEPMQQRLALGPKPLQGRWRCQSGTNYIFQGLAYNSSDLKPPETTPCTVNTSGYVYAYVQNGSNTVYYAYVNSTSDGQPCYQNIPSSAISNTSTGVSYQTTNTTSYYNTTTMPGLGWNQINNSNYSMLSTGITSNGQMRISYANSSSNGTWFQNAATGAVFYGTNSVSSQTNCSQTYTTVSGVKSNHWHGDLQHQRHL